MIDNVVARDGIEPPTPAFSGLDSFEAIIFITKTKSRLDVPKTAHLLGQEWDKIVGRSKIAFPVAVLFRSWRFRCRPDDKPVG